LLRHLSITLIDKDLDIKKMEITTQADTAPTQPIGDLVEKSTNRYQSKDEDPLMLRLASLERRIKNSDRAFSKAQKQLDNINDACQSLLSGSVTKNEINNLKFLIWIAIISSCVTSALMLSKAL
jgi:uncharacterized protein YpuA (DUF1002 family)